MRYLSASVSSLTLLTFFLLLYFKILNITGDSAKAFGRDVGRNTEGRRNHIDSYTFKANDGTNRTRIRFNIKGSKGQVRVWTEVCTSTFEYRYLYFINFYFVGIRFKQKW